MGCRWTAAGRLCMAFSMFHVPVQRCVGLRAGRSEQAGLLSGLHLLMQAALDAHEGQSGPAVGAAGGLCQLQGLLDECRAERDALHGRLQQAQVWASTRGAVAVAETEKWPSPVFCSCRKALGSFHALRDRHA